MLGWHITIYRQEAGGTQPASLGARPGERLAVWQAGVAGLQWIDDLEKQGLATRLGGHGYPTEYTAQLEQVRAPVLEGPPHARARWLLGEGDIVTGAWAGQTTIDEEVLRAGDPHEWILIQVWDES